MTVGPFMYELLKRLQMLDADAALTAAGDAVVWQSDDSATITLITSEDELADTIRHIGRDVRDDLWPGSSIEDAGFNLLLVHIDDVLATRYVTEPLRLTRTGLIWPEARRPVFEGELDPEGGPYYWTAEAPGGDSDPGASDSSS
jgi:hypothetical protein